MLTAAERMYLKNGIERILHVPGNYKGGILEMALVCDYRMPEEKLRERTKDVIGLLKQQGEVFGNVRFNLVKWAAGGGLRKETPPMAYAAIGQVFEDYRELNGSAGEGYCSLDELTRQLKLYFARSKLVILLTDGEYDIVDEKKVRENMQPFLHKKLLVWERDKILYGTEYMMKELERKRKENQYGEQGFCI